MSDFAADTDTLNRMAARSLPLWGIEPQTPMELINLSENATYKVMTEPQPRILRLCHVGYHTEAEILSEIAWIEALHRARDEDIFTAAVIAGVNGATLQALDDEDDRQRYHFIMFEFLSGSHCDEQDNLTESFRRLGRVTAALHLHVRNWKKPPDFTRAAWDFDGTIGQNPHWGRWQSAPAMQPETEQLLARAAQKIEQNLSAYGQTRDNYGLIHGDLRLANFLSEGQTMEVIDFDDCGFGWLMYDIGAAFSFIENHPQKQTMIKAWCQGYQTRRALSADDIAMIPTFIMLRRLVLLGWIASRPHTALAQKQAQPFTKDSCLLAEQFLQ